MPITNPLLATHLFHLKTIEDQRVVIDLDGKDYAVPAELSEDLLLYPSGSWLFAQLGFEEDEVTYLGEVVPVCSDKMEELENADFYAISEAIEI